MAKDKVKDILSKLKTMGNPKNREGMARYGIRTDKALGIPIWPLRDMAKELGHDHDIALRLWSSGIHEARLLAVFVDDPKWVTEQQMEDWAKDFYSWDLCDQACTSLFDASPYARDKALEWASREEEFVRRGAFALMAGLAVHDKQATDESFEGFLIAIRAASDDDRNYVKKAVNWALRNIGKRNHALNQRAIQTAREIKETGSKAGRWIASDALRELESDKVRVRLARKVRRS